MYIIRRLSPSDIDQRARWDRFVHDCPDATFFHRAGWQTVIESTFQHRTYFLFAEGADGLIEGVLPLVHANTFLFGSSLASLPFAVYGGVASRSAAAASALEAEALRLSRELRVPFLELRNRQRRHADWPLQDLYVTFRKPILAHEEANMSAIPRKQRAMVRKGIQGGLRSEIDPDLDRFFPMYAKNMLRHGSPALPRRWFEALRTSFGDDCEVLSVIDARGCAISGVMSFYFRDEVLPYYAGDEVEARALAGNDFKYWELMRRACARGLKVFDFGRSKRDSGSYAFKKNWGFEPQPLYYEYCLNGRDQIPQNNPANAKYQLLIAAWKKLPLGVANRLGPMIVRGLG